MHCGASPPAFDEALFAGAENHRELAIQISELLSPTFLNYGLRSNNLFILPDGAGEAPALAEPKAYFR
jgi:hypothetical protein